MTVVSMQDGEVNMGHFQVVTVVEDGLMCDGLMLPFIVIGPYTLVEQYLFSPAFWYRWDGVKFTRKAEYIGPEWPEEPGGEP